MDAPGARATIVETLASYAARTHAEMLQAAHVIALGMTTLDVLAEAKTAEMSTSMRIRYRGCASSLNRATRNAEQALDRRRAYDPPVTPEPIPEPVKGSPDTEVQSTVEHARVPTDTCRNRLAMHKMPARGPRPITIEERNKQLWAGAMLETLQQMGMPNGPAPAT
jgi:hypothetical protein